MATATVPSAARSVSSSSPARSGQRRPGLAPGRQHRRMAVRVDRSPRADLRNGPARTREAPPCGRPGRRGCVGVGLEQEELDASARGLAPEDVRNSGAAYSFDHHRVCREQLIDLRRIADRCGLPGGRAAIGEPPVLGGRLLCDQLGRQIEAVIRRREHARRRTLARCNAARASVSGLYRRRASLAVGSVLLGACHRLCCAACHARSGYRRRRHDRSGRGRPDHGMLHACRIRPDRRSRSCRPR